MKKIILALMIFFMIFMVLPPSLNSFNMITGEINCEGVYTCLHEEGHKRDREKFFISQSSKFKETVKEYHKICEPNEAYCFMIEHFPGILGNPMREDMAESNLLSSSFWNRGWGGYTELYARMYQYCLGDVERMPEVFQPFFTN
jgi:hypothetical protein